MNGLIEAARLKQRHLLIITALMLPVVAVLLLLSQPLAAALIPFVTALLVELNWRDERARALAQSITAGQPTEKIEVSRGAWGELCRAVNGLLQQRRIQDRLQAAASAALPDDAVRAVLAGDLPSNGELRVVTVLLVGQASDGHLDMQARQAAFESWQALAQMAQTQTQQYGALLQPCGDGFMLVFGAFTTRPTETTVVTALEAAHALQRAWKHAKLFKAGGLTLTVASGPALVGILPGLGYCVVGGPVEEALEITRLAGDTPGSQLLCGESAYYVLKRNVSAGWRSTELRVATGTGKPQPVYSWHSAASVQQRGQIQKAAR